MYRVRQLSTTPYSKINIDRLCECVVDTGDQFAAACQQAIPAANWQPTMSNDAGDKIAAAVYMTSVINIDKRYQLVYTLTLNIY